MTITLLTCNLITCLPFSIMLCRHGLDELNNVIVSFRDDANREWSLLIFIISMSISLSVNYHKI